MGIRAVEAGIIKLSADQRTFTWGTTNRKLMTVPYEENPYSALTVFFKTDEGFAARAEGAPLDEFLKLYFIDKKPLLCRGDGLSV